MRDQHRHQSQVDPEADRSAILTFGSSVADWRSACDLVGWRRLGRALNQEWNINLSTPEWQGLLEPAGERYLRSLCEAVSEHAEIETIPEKGFLGCRSPEARAMRALARVLVRIGVSRQEIRASTPLEPLLTEHGWHLLSPCVRLAPGALPPLKAAGRLHCFMVIMLLVFLCGGALSAISPIGVLSFCLAALILILLWIPYSPFRGSLLLPGIHTLGELATCLAKTRTGEPAGCSEPRDSASVSNQASVARGH